MLTARHVLAALHEGSPPLVKEQGCGIWQDPSSDDLLIAAAEDRSPQEPPELRLLLDAKTATVYAASAYAFSHTDMWRLLRLPELASLSTVMASAHYRGGQWRVTNATIYEQGRYSLEEILPALSQYDWGWVNNTLSGADKFIVLMLQTTR